MSISTEWYQAQSPEEWPPLSGIAVHVDHDKFILFDTEEEVVMIRYMTVSTDTRVFGSVDLDIMLDTIVGDLRTEGWVGEFVYDPARDPGDAVFCPGTVVN